MNDWHTTHLTALTARLEAVRAQPDGVLHEAITPLHHIQIIKLHDQVLFFFVEPGSGELHGPMSRIDLARPLHLQAEYTQAAMLTLLWRPQPARVCMLGLAGGRLTLLFYHHFAAAQIDNVDIDPAVGEIATRFFGTTFDQRNTLTIQDARAFMVASQHPYDIIVMDAFRDDSDDLNHLATLEFYATCQARLARGGVLCANLLKSDSLFLEKMATFLASFRHVFVDEQKHGVIVFGNDDTRLTRDDFARRATALQREHAFDLPLEQRAVALRVARAVPAWSRAALRDVPLLTDP